MPVTVPSEGGVTYRVRRGRGQQYRIWQLSAADYVMVYENNGSGTLLGSPTATMAYLDLVAMGSTGTDLYFSAVESEQKLIIEPIVPGLSSSLAPSPLLFVLKSTDSNPRLLVGAFYDVEGKEMYPTSTSEKTQFSMSPSDTAKTLYSLAKAAESTFPIFADCWEFRGVLYGGPVRITPYYFEPDPTTVDSDYVPADGSPIIYPGPVRLGGASDSIWQPSTNPGFMDPGVNSISVTITGNATSAAQVLDCRGSVLGILLFKVSRTTSDPKNIRVRASRKTTTLGSSSVTFAPSTLSADEIFTVAAGSGNDEFMIELEGGLYDVTFEMTNVESGSTTTTVQWTAQRLQ